MTTIAYRDGVMAGDTKINGPGSAVSGAMVKVKKINGYLVGVCGDAVMVAWLHKNFTPDLLKSKYKLVEPTPKAGVDFEALIIDPKRNVHILEASFLSFKYIKSLKYIAVGSGGSVALGAMYHGATAKEAVQAACHHDTNTGGKIVTIALE